MTAGHYDAIILAGGRARRLDGVSKPDVLLAGCRLLDHSLRSTSTARHRVVVGPDTLAVPPGILLTQEHPAHGGPVAGIEAGLAALVRARTGPGTGTPPVPPAEDPLDIPVLVLACDIPFVASAVPRLLAHLPGVDGAHLLDREARPQWLAAVYRTVALQRALAALAADGGTRNAPFRRLAAHLTLTGVPVRGDECADIDTWADHAHLEAAVAASPAAH